MPMKTRPSLIFPCIKYHPKTKRRVLCRVILANRFYSNAATDPIGTLGLYGTNGPVMIVNRDRAIRRNGNSLNGLIESRQRDFQLSFQTR